MLRTRLRDTEHFFMKLAAKQYRTFMSKKYTRSGYLAAQRRFCE